MLFTVHDDIVPADRLLDEAFALAEKICGNGPLAVRTAKEIAVRALNNEPNFVLEKAIGARVFSSADAKEGPKAFAEKRSPTTRAGSPIGRRPSTGVGGTLA